jgi:hypothetical protein
MARYRKIDPRIWNDEKFNALSDFGKLAFLFLLTHPSMTCLGAMRATIEGLAAELGWPVKIFSEAIDPAIEAGMIKLNAHARYIGLSNFLRYNKPEGPNSVKKAWVTAFDLLPECQEKRDLLTHCRAYLDAKSDGFKHAIGDAILHAFDMPSDIQEQEQEQEQKSPPPPKGEAVLTGRDIQDRWNRILGVKPCKALGSTIAKRLKARLAEYPDPAWWEALFTQVGQSDWLCGRSNGARGSFRATLDWVLGPKNLDKILAGNYDNPRTNGYGRAGQPAYRPIKDVIAEQEPINHAR